MGRSCIQEVDYSNLKKASEEIRLENFRRIQSNKFKDKKLKIDQVNLIINNKGGSDSVKESKISDKFS
jgi:hypothetical protein